MPRVKKFSKKNLYKYVPKFACKWRDVGIQLLKATHQHALNVIERNSGNDVEECCKRMIDKWLETDKNAKWIQLIKALKSASVSLITLANEIKESTKGDDDDDDDDDEEEEEDEDEEDEEEEEEDSDDSERVIRTSSFGELEVEFVKMTDKIKNALIKNNIDVGSLIEQLSAMSTVRDKKVPLFDENVFEKIKTIEDLWRKLRNYWSIRDYDILIFVLKIVECEEADDIYKEFLSRIDSSILKDIEFVLSCKECKGEGLKEHLYVKLGVKTLTVKIKKRAEEELSQVYNLEKYALTFMAIKEGCIELTYGISKALKSYLLQCQVTGHDLMRFSACNIVHLQICDKRLIIPSEFIEKDETFMWTSDQQDTELDELPSMKKIKLEVPVAEPVTIEDNKELPQIESEITCLICGDFFTDPITLSCSHTFCKQCIKNSLQKNKNVACCCPLCCKIVLQDDVESISINFNIKKLVEFYKKEAESKCGNCEKESSLLVWCIECSNMYCQNCNEIHKKWKDFKEHRVIDFMESSFGTCNTHFKAKDFYCKSCNSVICQDCALKSHPFETHDIDFIDAIVSKERENIKSAAASLEQLLVQVRNNAKMLEDHENLVDDKSKVNIEQIKSTFGEIHTFLACREEELLKNIEFNKLSLKQMLAIQKSNVALLEIQLEGCKGFTDNIVTANRTQQILLYHHWIMRQVYHLSEQIKNINCDLQSHKFTTALSAKSVEYISPLYYTDGLLYSPHSSIHVCTPLVKPKQVQLILTLKDITGHPLMYQSSNIKIRCNMEDNFIQNIQVKEQPDPDGVYHIYYSVKTKINHLIFVYWGDILINHEKVEVSVNTRDYVSINKSEIKIIKNGLPETPLKFPYSLAKGPNNQLIVGDDYTSQLVIFDDQLQYSHCIGKRGKENGEFLNITGIAVDNHEQLYVADSDLNCIQKFKLGGEFIYKFGSYGSDNGQFNSPHGLLVSGSKLFVCDRHNHRIQVFIHEEWSYTIGQQGTEPGSFKEPIDLSLSNDEDQIFVTDNKNHRVQIFAIDGQFLRVFGNLQGIPSTLPVGVFVTSDGYVLIACYRIGSIMVLDEDGTFVSAIEGSYQGKRIFNHPCGIVMMDNGKIIIACNLSNKLVVL